MPRFYSRPSGDARQTTLTELLGTGPLLADPRGMTALRQLSLATALLAVPGCTALEQLRMFVQPPRVEEAENRPAEIRLLGPAANRPLGGAGVRIWATVTNPNRFGFTLSRLRGQLYLEDSRATEIDLPLGLPLIAGGTETIPIDLSISFSDLPGLADVIRRAIGRQPIAYRVDGTIGVDAGRYGQPEFGPLTWLRGEISGLLHQHGRAAR